ncbi:DUF1289 domain-containing protein [Halomonas eurihalina]|uniref:DUF1289 domain-containing protein n=1 Tax=Halomonas eurihalina TaxID=42566 RepID=A0A5D9D9V7_HALER|nr:DUF1289 domain-containing protein [Halomonas eurihalina]MDR5858536.1 DUF1289 domain-containing protein [Halomonas eurihalina]TZG40728.1 DUF1289 domain-containing protein [Halomonas eurihalina]
MAGRVVSPCVGLCSTTVGDRVCRGCQRIDDEIRDWPSFDADERRRRMDELDALRVSVAGRHLSVVDGEALQAQLERHRIRFREDQPALSRAVELLRVGRGRIRDLSRYGLEPHVSLDAAALHERIASELMSAAEARRLSDADLGPSRP